LNGVLRPTPQRPLRSLRRQRRRHPDRRRFPAGPTGRDSRDPKTGHICQTLFQLSEKEAAELPQAERIEGSMLLREGDADDFPETGPEVHRIIPESQQSS